MLLHRLRKPLIRSAALSLPLKEPRRLARRAVKAAKEFLLSPGKILCERPGSLRLTLAHLAHHVFVAGGSGKGKSKLVELIFRQMASLLAGGTLIDPHGDTARAVRRYLIATRFKPENVLFLKPGMDGCFSFDPAADAPKGASREEYEQWLSSTVDRIIRAILRNVSAADQEVMNRLKRWLKNVITACLVATDGENTHVGLDKALVFTDPQRPEFSELYGRVRDHLPSDVRSDFEKLLSTQRPLDQEKWLESTINRLRELLSPIVRLIFGQHAQSVNLREVIQQRKIVLLDLSESEYLSREQGNVIGGLFTNFLLGTARRFEDENLRVTHFLVIDEAENYIGEDLRMGFAELRKFKLVIVVIFQDLTCLKKGELDLIGKVVSQCGLQLTFQQQNPDDVEFLAKAFGYGALDFTPLLTDTVLPDGYDWVTTKSLGFNAGATKTESHSQSTSKTESHTRQQHTAESIQHQVSLALSESDTESVSEGVSESKSVGIGWGRTEGHTEGVSTGTTEGTSEGKTEGTSTGRTDGEAKGRTWSSSEGHTHQVSTTASLAASQSETNAHSDGNSAGQSATEGGSSTDSGSQTVNPAGERSYNAGEALVRSRSHAETQAVTSSDSSGHSKGQTVTHGEGSSEGTTFTKGTGGSVTTNSSVSESENKGRSWAWNRGTSASRSTGESRGSSQTLSLGKTQGTSRSLSAGHASGITQGRSEGIGKTAGSSDGESHGTSAGETTGTAAGHSDGVSVTFQKMPLARHQIRRDQPTGKLLTPVADQLAKYMNILASLADRTLLVKAKGMGAPFMLGVHEVTDVRVSAADEAAFMERMRSAHGCFFDPRRVRATPAAAALREFVADAENPIA